MKIVTIIPVYNGGTGLRRCVDALLVAGQAASDIILVDDGSTDGQAIAVAGDVGTGMISLGPLPSGPAVARNRGAVAAKDADALLFIDADVLIEPDAIELFRAALLEDTDLDAIFGSYNDVPAAPGVISQYKNLLHHHMHQQAPLEASTFWSGCGIVRRVAFEHVGGFDERYRTASIEDIDLGMRLSDAGFSVHLRRDIQCCHLKHWALWSWLKTDILQRAVPWTKLIIARGGHLPDSLNIGYVERWSAVLALLCFLSLSAGLLWPELRAGGMAVGIASLIGFIVLQRSLLSFFLSQRGPVFALAALVLHLVYFYYSSTTFVLVQLLSRIRAPANSEGQRAA